MYIFRLKIHTHRRYVKKPSAETQVSTGANEKRFINKTYIYRFLKQRSFASSRGTHSKTGKNTMKPLIRILSLWLAALCFGACTDDDLIDGTPTPEPETGIVIRLSAGDLEQTRTELTSQANLHNVKEVYALLYQGHGDDATFYACDKLDWNPKDSTDETGVQEQRKEFLLPQSKNLAKGAYTVLCVGLDDQSGETYDLPAAIQKEGSTLSEAKATLAGSKGKEDIAKSELFAGWNQFHFAPDSLNIVEVEMKRRVAGVICYLTDVPYQLTKDDGTWRVQKVILRLFTQQNKSISLLRPEQTVVDNKYVDDFGDASFDTDSNSDILMEFDLSNYGPQENNKELYKIPVATGANQLPNTLLGGVYMIPIDKDEQENTIEVKLLGKVITLSGEKPVEEAEEIEIANFPAINDDIDFEATEGSTKNYPIRPNLIYHIGDKPSDEKEGTPESLAGTEVKIGVKCWENETVDVEFPSVPITLKMQLVNSELAPYTMQDPDDLSKPYYIFDCIGSTDNFLKVERSVLYNYWMVTVQDVSGGNFSEQDKMIYFGQKYNSTTPYPYKDTFYGSGIDYIPIAMTDYAKYDGETSRKIQIRLIAMNGPGEDAAEVTGTEVTMTVEQYNAIIVNNCAYSWFDLNSWYVDYIYGNRPSDTDGQYNSLSARKQATDTEGEYKKQYTGSALEKGYAISVRGSGAVAELKKEEGSWFLPAKDQLKSFMNLVKSDVEKYHITKSIIEDDDENEDCYWSSTAGSGMRFSHAIRINQSNEVEESHVTDVPGWKGYRTYKYRIRRARNLN